MSAIETTVSEVVTTIRSRTVPSEGGVRVFWLSTSLNRETFIEQLANESLDLPLVAMTVRKGFENPNLLPNDFADLLHVNREAIDRQLSASTNDAAGLIFLLLSRTELRIPQVSSPFVLPEWLRGGRSAQVELCIEDLTWNAAVPMNSALADIGQLSSLIYDAEFAILRRLRSTHSSDHRKTSGILNYLRRTNQAEEAIPDLIQKAEADLGAVRNKRGYRPSVAKGAAIVSRLWAVASSTPPEKFAPLCDALGSALSLDESELAGWHESVVSVLYRPTSHDQDATRRFCRNLLLSLQSACQFVTAAAHADAYPNYPGPLVRSLSLDIQNGLSSAILHINNHKAVI